jgi:protein-S-isoprenylcysteine O-methyltransferase Ste14
MTTARCFDLALLASLACLICLGLARALMLAARGVRVVAIDRQRTVAQALADLAQISCLLFWAYEVVAYTWPLSSQPGPAWFGVVLIDRVWAKAAGVVLLGGGLVIYAVALWSFGDSWRLGIDRERPGALITTGIFAWTRNPIYVSLDLLPIGTFFVEGRLIFLLLAVVNVALFHQLIRREERFLVDPYGDAYRDYCARVGRYVKWR